MPSQELPENIDSREIDILEALLDNGQLNVTELRNRLGLSNTQVNYSLQKLSDRNLIELHHPPNNGPIPDPKQAELTDEGVHALDYWDIDTEELSLAERVEVLERRLNQERENREGLEEQVEVLIDLAGLNEEPALPSIIRVRGAILGLERYLENNGVSLPERLSEESKREFARLSEKADKRLRS